MGGESVLKVTQYRIWGADALRIATPAIQIGDGKFLFVVRESYAAFAA